MCDVVDTRVLQAIAGVRTPWLTRVAEVAGLPAWQPEGDEPWVYDARIRLRLRPRSSRPT